MTMDIKRVEDELTTLGGACAYPATPDLVAGFWRGIADAEKPAQRSRLSPAWLGAVGAVIAVMALIAAVSPAWDAAADLFDRVNIFSTSEPLKNLPEGIAGEDASIEEAEAALGRQIEQPSYPEGVTLDRVILQQFDNVKAVVLFYHADGVPPFAMFVTDAPVGKGIVVDSGVSAERVSWPGTSTAYWFDGPHRVEYRDFEGRVIEDSVRRTGEATLVWERVGYVYRLEGAFRDVDEAIRVAGSLSD